MSVATLEQGTSYLTNTDTWDLVTSTYRRQRSEQECKALTAIIVGTDSVVVLFVARGRGGA